MNYRLLAALVSGVSLSGCGGGGDTVPPAMGSGVTMASVGKKLFFDENLSSNGNQSCASCHDPLSGFADPDASSTAPVSEGSVTGKFGDRNAPTAAYASFSPAFGKVTTQTPETDSKYLGGQFLDGRRSNLVEQVKDPFLNPVEMNNADAADVVNKVSNSSYAADFLALFGANAFGDVTTAYDNIAKAIAAFEASAEVNRFSAKFDAVMAGTGSFTPSEQRGFDLFKNEAKAKCANCHTVPDTGPILFTNHKYYNIGTPSNPNNPANIADSGFVDPGLGGTTVIDAGDAATERGKFRVPTLRNVELTKPYMHNGVYQTLDEVVLHYDIQIANEFVTPEVSDNMANEMNAGTFVGLNLNDQDRADLVAFMKTLTDR